MVEGADSCDVICNTEDPEELNRLCACALVDVGHVRESLGISAPGATTQDPGLHAHLFSPYALFVHRTSLDLMGAVAQAVFEIARNRKYAEHVLRWAPSIALHDPGSGGGVLGLDFHLTVAGPRLIEINTNPGGLCSIRSWLMPFGPARRRLGRLGQAEHGRVTPQSRRGWTMRARSWVGCRRAWLSWISRPGNNSCIRSSCSMPRHSRIEGSRALFAHRIPLPSGRTVWKMRMAGSTPSTTD